MNKLKTIIQKNKGKIAFLIFVNLFVLITNVMLFIDYNTSTPVTIGILSFVSLVDTLAILQVYGEYKGIEGLINTIRYLFSW